MQITLDSGAEVSMIKYSVASLISAYIKKSDQSALHADGVTPLDILCETHLILLRDNQGLQLKALLMLLMTLTLMFLQEYLSWKDTTFPLAQQNIKLLLVVLM